MLHGRRGETRSGPSREPLLAEHELVIGEIVLEEVERGLTRKLRVAPNAAMPT